MGPADIHGQSRFNFRHKHIQDGQETDYLRSAFERDFGQNGPSLSRLIQTTLKGWKRYKDHPDLRIRKCFEQKGSRLADVYAAAIWAMRKWYRKDGALSGELERTLRELYGEFGWRARVVAPTLGRWMYVSMKREAKRLDSGWTYEPDTFYEKNAKALALEESVALGT